MNAEKAIDAVVGANSFAPNSLFRANEFAPTSMTGAKNG
jgi:hypothetical protein